MFVNEKLPTDLESTQNYENDLCLIFIDIDNFKKINVETNKETGNIVLKEVGTILSKTIRLENDWTARYEEDTFIISLRNIEPKLQ